MLDVPVLLHDLIELDFGSTELAAVRDRASLPPGTASHVQAAQTLHALATVQRRSPADVFRWAGTRAVPALVKAYPSWIRLHSSARTVFLQLSHIAPQMISELFPDAAAVDVWEDMLGKDQIRLSFDGAEEVAWLLEGLASGIGAHFGERVTAKRGTAPVTLVDRKIIEIEVTADRRGGGRGGVPAAPGLTSIGRVG